MEKKYKILVIPSDASGGVGFYRSTQPHKQLEEQFDDFEVTFKMGPDFTDLSYFDKFSLIQMHKGLFSNMGAFYRAMKYFKEKGIVTVLDLDDYWKLDSHHPQYLTNKIYHLDKIVIDNIKMFDYITTTTPIFAGEIKKHNPNVVVLPNAINPEDERFKIEKSKSDFIRVGMVMGSTHEHDMKLMDGLVNRLPQSVKDKIQIVLCGFDTRGKSTFIDPNTREKKVVPLKPIETVWYRYEKFLTDNYSIVSDNYKKFLHEFMKDAYFPGEEHEHYRRFWTKDMDHYYSHYNNCDILLAPLETKDFNKMKSQLKAIECCFSHTALIASDFGPYTIDLVNAIEKGGTINKDGNALLVDPSKGGKQWAKYVEKLVNNPELLKQLQDNIYTSMKDKYDLRNVTKQRHDFYKEILEK